MFERVMNFVNGKAGKEKNIREELASLRNTLGEMKNNLGMVSEGLERSPGGSSAIDSLEKSIETKEAELEELLR